MNDLRTRFEEILSPAIDKKAPYAKVMIDMLHGAALLHSPAPELSAALAAAQERVRVLEEALRMIAGELRCPDNLMGNSDIARAALQNQMPARLRGAEDRAGSKNSS